jgi:hypothetical protein
MNSNAQEEDIPGPVPNEGDATCGTHADPASPEERQFMADRTPMSKPLSPQDHSSSSHMKTLSCQAAEHMMIKH